MRPATACSACRIHRRKCRVASSGAPCARCVSLKIDCSLSQASLTSYSPIRKKFSSIGCNDGSSISQEHDENLLPPTDVRDEVVNLYFKYIHDKHHSLFHQPTFMELLAGGLVPEVLLYAMVALAARFSSSQFFAGSHPWERGRPFALKCKELFDIRDISLTTVQASILLGTICFAEAEAQAEALYYSVANRLALMLDLLHKPTDTELERQVNLRVSWTLYMIDIWSSAGVRLPRQMDSTSIAHLMTRERFLLRWREVAFLPETTPGHLDPPERQLLALWAEMARLASIFGEIHDLNEALVREFFDQGSLQVTVAKIADKLDNWLNNLPSHMRMSSTNLTSYGSSGLGQTFVALHLGYHHFNQLLFYQFLAADCHSSVPHASRYADRCKEHAADLCDLIYTSRKTPGCECLYIMIGHMLVVASTVHIHTLLFSALEDQISQARCRLERNFETLTRLQLYWPNLELSLSRLRSFHNACMTSMETSFRMDQWMLQFLLEHGNAVGEKSARTGIAKVPREIELNYIERPAWTPSIRDWYVRAFQIGS